MRPLILLLIVLAQGCLLAPSRPGGGDDGDDGDDGPSDCVATGTTLGVSATAVLDSADRDTLIRAAHTTGGWYLYFYPSTAKTSLCPAHKLLLGNDIDSINAIQPAIVTGTTPDVLVLVSLSNGGSAVIDVRSASGAVTEVGRVEIAGYQPISISTAQGTDPVGFVALRGNELWFGGGKQGIAFADVAGGISGTANVLLATPASEGWYHAVAARNPHGANDFTLIGALGTFEANETASMIDTTLVIEYGSCSGPPDCQGRVAYTVSALTPIEAFSVDRTDGTLETVASMAGGFRIDFHMPMAQGPGGVLDAAIGALAGDNKLDVAMLWGTGSDPRQLIVYDGLLANVQGNVLAQRELAPQLSRVQVLRTGGESHILVLSDDPRRDAESCLVLNGTALDDCP